MFVWRAKNNVVKAKEKSCPARVLSFCLCKVNEGSVTAQLLNICQGEYRKLEELIFYIKSN